MAVDPLVLVVDGYADARVAETVSAADAFIATPSPAEVVRAIGRLIDARAVGGARR